LYDIDALKAFPFRRQFWDAQLEGLPKNIRVIAVDLPGFGESPALPLETITISDYTKAIFQLLDELQIKKAIFGGCSIGGYRFTFPPCEQTLAL
jgi:pimeloyl-ACP methyl ester carboxylesterase